jgi:hypothetical protein
VLRINKNVEESYLRYFDYYTAFEHKATTITVIN